MMRNSTYLKYQYDTVVITLATAVSNAEVIRWICWAQLQLSLPLTDLWKVIAAAQ